MRALGPPTILGTVRCVCEREKGLKIYHHCYIVVIYAVVVDWWFEEMGVRLEPVEVLEAILISRREVLQTILECLKELKAFCLMFIG